MLNQSGVTTVSAVTPKSILWDTQLAFAVPCLIDSTGISAGSDGKKIVKAGTPITGDPTNRGTAYTKATTSTGSNANGILLHDVDVTKGKANATVLLFGFVDLNKIDSTTAGDITANVKTALAGKITFLK